jgi:hypothetical protein
MEMAMLRGWYRLPSGDVDSRYEPGLEEGRKGGLEDVDSASGAELPLVIGNSVVGFSVAFGIGG